MSTAMLTNLLTMILCIAVLIQSVRMMRSLRAVKDGGLADTVAALEKATAQARTVLFDLKRTLGDCAIEVRSLEEAKGLRDELSVMIGIADGAAERIVKAVGQANAVTTRAPEAGGPMIDDDDRMIDDGPMIDDRMIDDTPPARVSA